MSGDSGGSAGLHGSAVMEAYLKSLGRKTPAGIVDTLLDVCEAWPNRAEGQRWAIIIGSIGIADELARLRELVGSSEVSADIQASLDLMRGRMRAKATMGTTGGSND